MSNKTLKITIQQAQNALENSASLTQREVSDILDSLQQVSSQVSPWWVLVLKVLMYALGLILAGYGTTAAACNLNIL